MIGIIGAGPSGSYLASLLATKGKDVNIYEEHLEVGNPMQCTGILSSSSKALNLRLSNKVVVNKIKRVELISPNNKSVEFKLKEQDLILDRIGFDKYLSEVAVKNGAKLYEGYRFLDFDGKAMKVKYNGKVKEIKTDILVGSDGPNSQVAKSAGIYGNRKFWVARQCRVKWKQDQDLFKVYFGVCPDFFGWIVPEGNDIARIGIGSEENSQIYFNNFLKKLNIKNIINYQGGLIPIYNPSLRRSKKNVYLLGDAAMQVKGLSVDGNESILIKEDGLIKNLRIGKLVDKYMSNFGGNVKNNSFPVKHLSLKLNENLSALSPGKNDGSLKFRKVDHVLKHRINEDLYEVILKNGFSIKTTGSHSIIVAKNNKFISKRVDGLKLNRDKVPLILNIPNERSLKKLNLIEMIIKEEIGLAKHIRIRGGKKLLYKKGSEVPLNYRNVYWYRDSIPMRIFLSKGMKNFKNVKLVYEPPKKKVEINNIIEITPKFCRLLGYYAAEGYCSDKDDICLCFGSNDKALVEDSIDCIKGVFGISAQKIQVLKNPITRRDSSYRVEFGGKLLSLIFRNIFFTGTNSKNKQISFIIFNIPDKLKLEFLKGYLRGDGYIRIRTPKERKNWSAEISVKTVSRKLASDLVILSLQLNLFPTISKDIVIEGRKVYGKKLKESKAYRISFSKKEDMIKLIDIFSHRKEELLNFIKKIKKDKDPLRLDYNTFLSKDFILKHKREFTKLFGNSWDVNYKTLSYNRLSSILDKTNQKDLDFVKTLIKNKIVLLPIKEIKRVKPSDKEVFDIEIPETNMFVGGLGPILLHNSGGGIIKGMLAAESLSEAILENKDYERLWRKKIGYDLYLSLKIRHFLNKFSNKDYNKLISILNPGMLKEFNREFPSKTLSKIAIKHIKLDLFVLSRLWKLLNI